MIPLHLLTDNGFKLLNNIKNCNIYDCNFKLKPSKFINTFENFYFPCYEITLSTGLVFTARSTERFKGLIFKPQEIKNELDIEPVSLYNSQDYLYTPFCSKDIFNSSNRFEQVSILNSLKSKFYEEDKPFKSKISNLSDIDSSRIPEIIIDIDSSFYKFLVISLLRGKIINLDTDLNSLSYKFNKNKDNHERMKKDLLEFFNNNNLNYEIIEYNKYFYVNYIDSTLTDYIEKLLKEDYNTHKNLFNNEYQSLFLMYLYVVTNNKFYMSQKTYLFFKTLAYNNNLVISVTKNPIKSNHNYSLASTLVKEEEEMSKEIPSVIFLEDGYLTKIEKIEPITKKGDANYLPEYLLIC